MKKMVPCYILLQRIQGRRVSDWAVKVRLVCSKMFRLPFRGKTFGELFEGDIMNVLPSDTLPFAVFVCNFKLLAMLSCHVL